MSRPSILPSALLNGVGTPNANISQLNTRPTGAPVNASMAALRLATHDSGPGWIATPSLYDSFIHNSTPVYPGALNKLLVFFGIIWFLQGINVMPGGFMGGRSDGRSSAGSW